MDVTDVRIRRIMTDGKLKAVASVTFDDVFVVHDIKIIQQQRLVCGDAGQENAGRRAA